MGAVVRPCDVCVPLLHRRTTRRSYLKRDPTIHVLRPVRGFPRRIHHGHSHRNHARVHRSCRHVRVLRISQPNCNHSGSWNVASNRRRCRDNGLDRFRIRRRSCRRIRRRTASCRIRHPTIHDRIHHPTIHGHIHHPPIHDHIGCLNGHHIRCHQRRGRSCDIRRSCH